MVLYLQRGSAGELNFFSIESLHYVGYINTIMLLFASCRVFTSDKVKRAHLSLRRDQITTRTLEIRHLTSF